MQAQIPLHQPGDVLVVRGKSYQLTELMGRGGQGSVYRARDAQGSDVALKLVPAAPRHLTEARILAHASRNAEHVVRLLDAGKTRSSLILVMECVEGIDLKELVLLCRDEGRYIPARVAVSLIQQGCEGLLEATQNAELAFHRDIKPGNLILSRHGLVKLIDFGIAHRQDMNYTGSLVGTPENMAPEQVGLDSNWKVDIRTDLYCMGLVLFELLTLETLHQFFRELSVVDRLEQVWEGRCAHRIKPLYDLHPALGGFLTRALQRRSEDRFQNPQEMIDALEGVKQALTEQLPLPEFAELVYQLAENGTRDPLLDRALPSRKAADTVSLDLELVRPTRYVIEEPAAPPERTRRTGVSRRAVSTGSAIPGTGLILWLGGAALTLALLGWLVLQVIRGS